MDATQFDALARQLNTSRSRRCVASLSLASLLAVTLAGEGAAKRGKKKKSCPKKRIKTFGCTKYKRRGCRKVKKPNGASCGPKGQCFGGLCRLPPTCQGVTGSTCMTGDECCSGECDSGACAPGAAGTLCAVDGDCQSGECVGFHCT